MIEALNSPLVVVAILGVAFGGVASLIREVSFGASKIRGKSAMDRNAEVLQEMVTTLKELNRKLDENHHLSQRVMDRVDDIKAAM